MHFYCVMAVQENRLTCVVLWDTENIEPNFVTELRKCSCDCMLSVLLAFVLLTHCTLLKNVCFRIVSLAPLLCKKYPEIAVSSSMFAGMPHAWDVWDISIVRKQNSVLLMQSEFWHRYSAGDLSLISPLQGPYITLWFTWCQTQQFFPVPECRNIKSVKPL